MQLHPLHRTADRPHPAPVNGAGPGPTIAGPVAERAAVTIPQRAGMAQFATMAAMLTGLWVAISPWFLTLQVSRGGNAAVNNLIIGLAIAGLSVLTIIGARSAETLRVSTLLAGVWLIISPFILDARVPITASMYWSNIWSGAVLIVIALAVLGLGRSPAAA